MKRSLYVLAFVTLLLAAAAAFGVAASAFDAGDGYCDTYVYAPGVYDMSVWYEDPSATFLWGASIGYHGDFIGLEDNDAYSGTSTSRMQLKTNDGLASGDWSELVFWCRVTINGQTRDLVGKKMWVATHSKLLSDLKADGAALTYIGMSSQYYMAERTVGDITYFDCPAGETFYPLIEWSGTDLGKYLQSELELKTEIHVIEDGKDVVCGKGEGYTPRKTGMGKITLRGDLVLYQCGQRMETIDTKSAVINVLTPDGIGKAVTKQSAAILEERYSQAKVLTTLPKGEEVTLIEQSGSYWKVVGGGYAGYIPVTALEVLENIESVDLSLPEPLVYAEMSTLAVPADENLYDLFDNEPVTWYDKTAGKFLNPGDRFLAGHTYELSIWVKAKNGKRFHVRDGSPAVKATVNNVLATVNKAYEQNPEEVIEITITYDHVHDLTKVTQVNPTCTKEGKLTYYKCSCGWCFEDYQGLTKITDENWGVIPARGHHESEWRSDGENHYKICLRRECGEVVEGTTGKHSGGKATCTQGAVCDICGLTYGSPGSHNWTDSWDYVTAEGHAHYCSNLCGSHSSLTAHRPGPAATSSSPQVCLDCGYVITPAISHTHKLEFVDTVPPTCTVPGKSSYYRCSCGACFENDDGLVQITDSDWGMIPPLGHVESVWQHDDTHHYRKCLRQGCGAIIDGTYGEHSGGTPTCVEEGYCHICGTAYMAAWGHLWSNEWTIIDDTGHARSCIREGCEAVDETEPHRPGPDATETTPMVCLDCGFVLKEATGVETEAPTKEPENTPEATAAPEITPTPDPEATLLPSAGTPETTDGPENSVEPGGDKDGTLKIVMAALIAVVAGLAGAAVALTVVLLIRKKKS